jgi:Transcriptional regulator, AbiEi antitoxin
LTLLQHPPYQGYLAVVTRRAPLSRLQEIAQDQWGLVTRRQVGDAGIGPTTIDRLTSPSGSLERVAYGVYQLTGAPIPDHRDLRAAWLQLQPAVPAWKRTADQGVVSHRSAASVYGLADLPADRHDFTVAGRRQTRRPDVRIHVGQLDDAQWITLGGLPVTRPSRIAADLLREREDPGAVAQIVVDALRGSHDDPGAFADTLAQRALAFGLRRGDGLALLRWLLGLADDPGADRWMEAASAHVDRESRRCPPRPNGRRSSRSSNADT